MSDKLHISSLLLRADPSRVESLVRRIKSYAGVEVPVADVSGKVIVVLESRDEQEIVRHMSVFGELDGVVSSALVYHELIPVASTNETPAVRIA